MPKFSIIIPCKEIDKYTEECILHCLNQIYQNYEILVLPDSKTNKKFKKTKIIPTGLIKPSIKRNLAASKAKGQYLAFIDSDARPDKNWLKNSEKYLIKDYVGAVGGPNLTPPEDTFMQKVSGDILSSHLTGFSSIRYKIKKGVYAVKELPSCNLVVRKSLFQKIKGFDPSFLTAEDSKLCFQINDFKKLVIYASDVIVYHHRRDSFKKHLKQIWIYGRDIAWLIKEKFSFDKLYYSLLSIFVIFIVIGAILAFFSSTISRIYLLAIFIYLIIVFFGSLIYIKRFISVFPGIILTHITYGLGFIYGVLTKKK